MWVSSEEFMKPVRGQAGSIRDKTIEKITGLMKGCFTGLCKKWLQQI